MNKTITGKSNDIDIEMYTPYQLCRWTALEEAVNLIGDKCEERKIDFNTVELNPLDIRDFVDKTTDLIYAKFFTT